jgi:hypothetical protein
MNLVKTLYQYDVNNTIFCDPIKNNIINDGSFIRILYSNEKFVLNGIYLLVSLNNVSIEKLYSKYKCNFKVQENLETCSILKKIEDDLLKKYITNKIPCYKIYEQINMECIKIFMEIQNIDIGCFVLKISGIWETANNYGLTYKFLQVNENNIFPK